MSYNDTEAFDGKDTPNWNEPPRCGYRGGGPAALPPCVRHRGHLGQHDHAGHSSPPVGWGNVGYVKTQPWDGQTVEQVRPGGNLRSYLEDLVTGGVIQTPAASPYRSEGFKIYRTASGVAFLAALATSEHEAQLLVGGTTADKLWRDKAEAARGQAKYWEGRWRDLQQGGMVSAADHAKVWEDLRKARDRHKRATAHIARLTAELATATAQLEGARDAAAKLRGNCDHWRTKAGQLDVALANTNRNQSLVWWRDRVSTLQKRVEELQQAQDEALTERRRRQDGRQQAYAEQIQKLRRSLGMPTAVPVTHQNFPHLVELIDMQIERWNHRPPSTPERQAEYADMVDQLRKAMGFHPGSADLRANLEVAWPALRDVIQHALERLHNRQQLLDAADAKLTDLKQRAERIEIERSKWMGRHGELAGAALHMLRRLNTIVGDRDAAEFTRAAATEAVDKLLDQLKVTNGANLALSERVEQLEEMRAKRDQIYDQLQVLRMNSGCPSLMPIREGSPTMLEHRKCIRVNGHDGVHARTDGTVIEVWST